MDCRIGEREWVRERLNGHGNEWVGAESENGEKSAWENEEGEANEESEESGEADCAEGGGCCVGEGGEDDLAGCGRWDREAMKVPLRNRGGGSGALDASAYGQRPEVDEDKENAQEPGAGVNNEEVFGT